MNDYVEVRIDLVPCTPDMTDVAAALLADVGFESFLPDDKGLTAYIPAKLYNEDLPEVLRSFPFPSSPSLTWTAKTVEGQDWNNEWEKNYFKPIVIDDQCLIHSSFHTDLPRCRYDITIDPKMAFGTGHHSTTSLMLRRILSEPLDGRCVVDMGTGTGILAILSAMRGATKVYGVEIDEAAYVNAIDNISLNGHPEITLLCGGAEKLEEIPEKADLFLANINRNVITGDLPAYSRIMKPGATACFSGFYTEDVPVVREAAEKCGLKYCDMTSDKNWACIRFTKL